MKEFYENPLCTRYASKHMSRIFSDDNKFRCWRMLWIALAKAEKDLGIAITDEQIAELTKHAEDINYETASQKEKQLRHDVMAHIHAYGEQCPSAMPILHLGATSAYVGDNADLIMMREALVRTKKLLVTTIDALAKFAQTHKSVQTLSYTHFQPAQPTTVGKRACLWMADLISDLERVEYELRDLKLLGCKGTTGTGASFLELFGGDHEKVKQLDARIAQEFGFASTVAVSGQTYSRKTDYRILAVLSGIAQSAAKFSNDIRLLSHLKEFDEPFESGQVGSSAMAYKRNPMRSERIASLSRYVISIAQNAAFTAAGQWFERTLDDSANRRMTIPEAFLSIDAILLLYCNIISGGKVYAHPIQKHLDDELPFMVTEAILMRAVKKGGDRQVLHEAIRRYAVESARAVKERGEENLLVEMLADDPNFRLSRKEIQSILAQSFCGRAVEQTEEYLSEVVVPLLAMRRDCVLEKEDIRV